MSDCEQTSCGKRNCGGVPGTLYAVGIGPGGSEHRTYAAVNAIEKSEVIVGYTTYIELISDLIGDREVVSNGMRQEVDRVSEAIRLARSGKSVALISSGDAGVYGMAGLAIELSKDTPELNIVTIPGVTAANCAASVLGAPLMLDYSVISLSDLLVSWEQIEKRLDAVACAGMVVALYNPRSKKRIEHLDIAVSIFKKYRSGNCLVGVVTNAGCYDQSVEVVTLDTINDVTIGMRSMVVIGNEDTILINGRLIQPRGYQV